MKINRESEEILNGNLVKVILLITFPVIVTNFMEAIYGIIDSLFVVLII